jgi:hypothetical protein
MHYPRAKTHVSSCCSFAGAPWAPISTATLSGVYLGVVRLLLPRLQLSRAFAPDEHLTTVTNGRCIRLRHFTGKIRPMSEAKVPLCDCHYRKMVPHVSALLPAGVFKCVVANCGRYYATRYGYFNLIAGELPAEEKIDPADRQMKLCTTKQHSHSYLAITRPKNSGPGNNALWRWHCYACSR